MMSRRFALLTLLFAVALPIAAQPASAQPAGQKEAAQVLAHISEATVIAEGRGTRVVYVFFDPNCPYCHKLFRALRPWVGKDDLQLRWVPVAVLTPTSVTKAAAILQARNRLEALKANEDNYGTNREAGPGGGIVPATSMTAPTRNMLKANNAVLDRAGIYNAVPLMVFRTMPSGAQLFIGAPQSSRQLADLLNSVR